MEGKAAVEVWISVYPFAPSPSPWILVQLSPEVVTESKLATERPSRQPLDGIVGEGQVAQPHRGVEPSGLTHQGVGTREVTNGRNKEEEEGQ